MATVVAACQAHYQAHIGDCSGFAEAVATAVGVTLTGNADAIVDVLQAGSLGWTPLDGGPAAQNQTINHAWVAGDRDKVSYAAHDIAG